MAQDSPRPDDDLADRALPAHDRQRYVCPHPSCSTFAHQVPGGLLLSLEGRQQEWMDGWTVHRCSSCDRTIIWLKGEDGYSMIYPVGLIGEPPNKDMPPDVLRVYEEARRAAPVSRRSAAALLRLALQMLVDQLETGSGDINTKIGRLVQKGLLPQIQQAMDVLRVVGNNAVHPGQIDLDDDPELVPGLFRLANLVVDQMISLPQHAQSLYSSLPPAAKHQVSRRDGAVVADE